MSAHPPIIETADAFLGRLAALDMQAAEHVHACLMDATRPAEVADLARAYARASRCLRQTLALHARLKGDRERAARERSSSSMRRVLVIAMAAWAAIASRRGASPAAQASVREENTVSAPNGPASPISGAARTEWMPAAWM